MNNASNRWYSPEASLSVEIVFRLLPRINHGSTDIHRAKTATEAETYLGDILHTKTKDGNMVLLRRP